MFSLAKVTNEVYLRIEQSPDVPPLRRHGVYQMGKAFFDVITAALAAGEDVTIPHFGKFKVEERAARVGRNPRTGEKIKIAAKTVPRFRASRVLRERVEGEKKPSVPVAVKKKLVKK